MTRTTFRELLPYIRAWLGLQMQKKTRQIARSVGNAKTGHCQSDPRCSCPVLLVVFMPIIILILILSLVQRIRHDDAVQKRNLSSHRPPLLVSDTRPAITANQHQHNKGNSQIQPWPQKHLGPSPARPVPQKRRRGSVWTAQSFGVSTDQCPYDPAHNRVASS